MLQKEKLFGCPICWQNPAGEEQSRGSCWHQQQGTEQLCWVGWYDPPRGSRHCKLEKHLTLLKSSRHAKRGGSKAWEITQFKKVHSFPYLWKLRENKNQNCSVKDLSAILQPHGYLWWKQHCLRLGNYQKGYSNPVWVFQSICLIMKVKRHDSQCC